ncbi:MAG: bifunctional proline dehydrogenase/L-glutamate gamma-semialdehyde dehydrogenase [Planctomycetales bacterium]|nr:bifunctional proline dehydrogenase/L-glutamate gamma-semialdehyde dehydrogenase [Planctomycetales bacterium]
MSPTISGATARRVEEGVAKLLQDFTVDANSSLDTDVQQAMHLARKLQIRAAALQTPAERRQQAELDHLIQSPSDKATMIQLTDQAFRSRLPHRAADQLIHILDIQGVPRFFGALDRTLLRGFQSFGAYLPGVAMPLVKEKMKHETANVVLPAEEQLLRGHLHHRREEGVRMNVNYLGESLLGEREAQRRLKMYLQALQRPEIEVISVKISTIFSQISALAREHTIETLCDRMELLYRAAAKSRFTRHDGTEVAKFVYLDMEEYRDKEITACVFMRTLDRPGLEQVRAGIALQAYLPDSLQTQRQITAWARNRTAAGGASVTIRLVKGANMEMERVDACLHGWPLATYCEKLDTDANYLRMLRYGMEPENLASVSLGVASHNLFTLAYGLVLAYRASALDRIQFEMLEGMANHQRRALFELSQNVLLYAPACRQEEFINAIGYLVRRLDENTGLDNFLRHAFSLRVDSDDWQRLERAFQRSFDRLATVAQEPNRTQDRQCEIVASPEPSISGLPFVNEPDTDWSLSQNSDWAAAIIQHWHDRCEQSAAEVPLVIVGQEIADGRQLQTSTDPSRPGTIVARFVQAAVGDVPRIVECARNDADGWRSRSANERCEVLNRVAEELRVSRGELMGAMLAEGGKTLAESDPEVSEAIDFCRFYAQTAQYFHDLPGLTARGRGVAVVVSPWNFPLAIPCGGIAAALAAGNTVIFKPASDTVLVSYLLCQCFWKCGVPKTALQFMPGSGRGVGQQLASHDGVDAVILTGGTETGLQMLAAKPSMPLFAETGGKNATIVTALSDRDLAIKHVLHSAFSHSGQKCSATSLLILEAEVYHDPDFRERLCDAIESLPVGSAWQLPTKVSPLIRPPRGELEKALKELESGESWAVMPRLHVDENPHLVSPGVKWGVQPGSVTHCTEFFGPLLGVMAARDLHEAIDLVNATGYGLTSGLESLDEREHQLWQEGIRAGNLYINRPTTGAIVLRQPFGGVGKSAVGPGIKAGGPNYVVPFMQFEDHPDSMQVKDVRDLGDTGLDDFCDRLLGAVSRQAVDPVEANAIIAAAQSYEQWMAEEFDHAHDHFQLRGEDNLRRYLPRPEVHVRVDDADTMFDLFARALAARTACCRAVISSRPGFESQNVNLLHDLTHEWAGAIEFVEESDAELGEILRGGHSIRLRYAHPSRVPIELRNAAARSGQYIADAPVVGHGRIELLWYFQEQSLSHVYHRYGNLGRRSKALRTQPC